MVEPTRRHRGGPPGPMTDNEAAMDARIRWKLDVGMDVDPNDGRGGP